MRVGIFGGTFNPPHKGHINMCNLFLKEMSLDKLFVIPTSIPPHKQIDSKTTAKERFEMAQIAFSNVSNNVFVSDIEIKRNGKSYSADTIKELKSQGYNDLYFLCGTDMLLTLDLWYMPEYIFANSTIVYIRREEDLKNDFLILNKIAEYKHKFNANIINIKAKPIEISSSMVRESIKNNVCVDHFLTKEILEYIRDKNLYKDE